MSTGKNDGKKEILVVGSGISHGAVTAAMRRVQELNAMPLAPINPFEPAPCQMTYYLKTPKHLAQEHNQRENPYVSKNDLKKALRLINKHRLTYVSAIGQKSTLELVTIFNDVYKKYKEVISKEEKYASLRRVYKAVCNHE